jgi:transposase-like protein
MGSNIEKLIEIVHKMPEKCVDNAIEEIEKIIEKYEETETPECPHCQNVKVQKNGTCKGKQRYICKECGKTFGKTTQTVMFNSHCGEAVWKQVIAAAERRVMLF